MPEYRSPSQFTVTSYLVFFEDGLEAEGVSFANVLNAEVVYEEAEYDGAPFVSPQPWGGNALVVVVILNAVLKECGRRGLLNEVVRKRHCGFRNRSSN